MAAEIKPNKRQQECIDKIEGKYLVLAGPGTGKTFTVTQRIKAMLERKDNPISPERILCLTFSEVAANQMKCKLTEAMGGRDVNVNIYTYHGFCNEILSTYAEEFELPEDYRVITGPISKQLLKECIDEYDPKYYRNKKSNPYVYFSIISGKISQIKKCRYKKEDYFDNIEKNPEWIPELKRIEKELKSFENVENVNPKDIEKLESAKKDQEDKIGKAKEIWEYYELYKTKMEQEHYVDFDDMIMFVLDKFESSPAFLNEIASKYDYVLVDEYQDTNESQNNIVFHLTRACNNVFVVGDDDQIIFSFQGANLDTIQGFLREFPDTQVICLNENMRSTQEILDVARIIAKKDDRRLEENPEFKEKYGITKDLEAKNKDLDPYKRPVRFLTYKNYEEELAQITDEIVKLINSPDCPKDKNGKKLSEIAVIATSHEQLADYAQALRDKDIFVELKDGRDIFEIKSVVTMFYYLQMLLNTELYSDKILKLLLMPPFEVHPLDFAKIYDNMSCDKTFIETMREIKQWKKPDKIEKFLTSYDKLIKFISSDKARNIITEVGIETGIYAYYLKEETNRNDNILGLKKLADTADEFFKTHNKIGLEEFVEYLLMIQSDRDLCIRTDKPDIMMNAVQLTTYHSAKGKEYEYVYMPTLQRSSWESSSKSLKPQIPVGLDKYKTDAEWKLYRLSDRVKTMYVGMTRAKHTLRLSYVLNKGKTQTYPSAWIMEAKQLIEPKDLTEPTETLKEDKNGSKTQDAMVETAACALDARPYNYKRDFKALVNAVMENRTPSPSLLNAYQGCPRQFLYHNILKFDARLGSPDGGKYGDAVHQACEFLIDEGIKNKEKQNPEERKYPSKERFIQEFKNILMSLNISTLENRKTFEQRGERELDKFYQHLIHTPLKNLYAKEYEIKLDKGETKFYGRADKIEINDDGTYNIVDYKTSDPVKKEAISKTGSKKDYYNQMCLYKYYFEKTTGKKVKKTSFEFTLDCSVAELELTSGECEEVAKDLQTAIKSINECEFEPNYNSHACEHCSYRDFCKFDTV